MERRDSEFSWRFIFGTFSKIYGHIQFLLKWDKIGHFVWPSAFIYNFFPSFILSFEQVMFCMTYELRSKKEMALFCLGELFLWPRFLFDREHSLSASWRSTRNLLLRYVESSHCVLSETWKGGLKHRMHHSSTLS